MSRRQMIVTNMFLPPLFALGCSPDLKVDTRSGGALPTSGKDGANIEVVQGTTAGQTPPSKSPGGTVSQAAGEAAPTVPKTGESEKSTAGGETVAQIDYETAKRPIDSSGSPQGADRVTSYLFEEDDTTELQVICSDFKYFDRNSMDSFRSDCRIVHKPEDPLANPLPYIVDVLIYTWKFSFPNCPGAQLMGTYDIPNPNDPASVQPATSVIVKKTNLPECAANKATIIAGVTNKLNKQTNKYTAAFVESLPITEAPDQMSASPSPDTSITILDGTTTP